MACFHFADNIFPFKWPPCRRWHFFFQWQCWDLFSEFPEFFFPVVLLTIKHALDPIGHETLSEIWTGDGIVYWRIYTSLCLNLTTMGVLWKPRMSWCLVVYACTLSTETKIPMWNYLFQYELKQLVTHPRLTRNSPGKKIITWKNTMFTSMHFLNYSICRVFIGPFKQERGPTFCTTMEQNHWNTITNNVPLWYIQHPQHDKCPVWQRLYRSYRKCITSIYINMPLALWFFAMPFSISTLHHCLLRRKDCVMSLLLLAVLLIAR